MNLPEIVWQWVQENQITALCILIYLVASALPRPHPDEVLSPGWRYFWTVVDRLTIFTAHRVPGSVKLIFARSPRLEDEKPPADKGDPPPPAAGTATGGAAA